LSSPTSSTKPLSSPSLSTLNNNSSTSATMCLARGSFCNTARQSPLLIVFHTKNTYITMMFC
jgi:hypothetical protein